MQKRGKGKTIGVCLYNRSNLDNITVLLLTEDGRSINKSEMRCKCLLNTFVLPLWGKNVNVIYVIQ